MNVIETPSGQIVRDDSTGFRMTDDGKIFHHGRFVGTIRHAESYVPGEESVYPSSHAYVAQGVEIRPTTRGRVSGVYEQRSIASETRATVTSAEVVEIEAANR